MVARPLLGLALQSTKHTTGGGLVGVGGKKKLGKGKSPGKPGGEVDVVREKLNSGLIFEYADWTFSKGKRLFNWPGICAKHGWDHTKLCGPRVMSHRQGANRDLDCVNPAHHVG